MLAASSGRFALLLSLLLLPLLLLS